jgi:hypothetical protein
MHNYFLRSMANYRTPDPSDNEAGSDDEDYTPPASPALFVIAIFVPDSDTENTEGYESDESVD